MHVHRKRIMMSDSRLDVVINLSYEDVDLFLPYCYMVCACILVVALVTSRQERYVHVWNIKSGLPVRCSTM